MVTCPPTCPWRLGETGFNWMDIIQANLTRYNNLVAEIEYSSSLSHPAWSLKDGWTSITPFTAKDDITAWEARSVVPPNPTWEALATPGRWRIRPFPYWTLPALNFFHQSWNIPKVGGYDNKKSWAFLMWPPSRSCSTVPSPLQTNPSSPPAVTIWSNDLCSDGLYWEHQSSCIFWIFRLTSWYDILYALSFSLIKIIDRKSV